MTTPLEIVCFLIKLVFSDIHAMFMGCVKGHDVTTTATKYLLNKAKVSKEILWKSQTNILDDSTALRR
jgi:hypothetical protein